MLAMELQINYRLLTKIYKHYDIYKTLMDSPCK